MSTLLVGNVSVGVAIPTLLAKLQAELADLQAQLTVQLSFVASLQAQLTVDLSATISASLAFSADAAASLSLGGSAALAAGINASLSVSLGLVASLNARISVLIELIAQLTAPGVLLYAYQGSLGGFQADAGAFISSGGANTAGIPLSTSSVGVLLLATSPAATAALQATFKLG